MTIVTTRPTQARPEEWFAEILLAIEDARSTKPFALLTGTILRDRELFHLAPLVTFKFRGLDPPEEERRHVTEAVLANYVVFTAPDNPRYVPGLKKNAKLAFALCYVAAHHTLGIIDDEQVEAIMSHCEDRLSSKRR